MKVTLESVEEKAVREAHQILTDELSGNEMAKVVAHDFIVCMCLPSAML